MLIVLIIVLVGLAVGACLIARGFWENQNPVITEYKLQKESLPSAFKGFKIAHISDYHNTEIGVNNQKLLSLIKKSKPDIIVITGDIIDSRKTDEAVALNFAKQLASIAPCFYTSGNHESRYAGFAELISKLENCAVKVLQNERVAIERAGQTIFIAGVSSPRFYFTKKQVEQSKNYVKKTIESLKGSGRDFTLVLSHHPEYANEYGESGADVVFSGHAHGGQFILPLIGGLYAPEQGVLPRYTQGVKRLGRTDLIISRGIGNSTFPFRLNNRPEVVLTILK
ncbi:MAG: metallophosphoesterase [Clostridia bacterium]|nr:metallophosphoesterase [Clostridia bacterium]